MNAMEKLNQIAEAKLNGIVNAYQGEYMVQYSWAEMTAGRLAFRGLSS